jgi:hypothetical protein
LSLNAQQGIRFSGASSLSLSEITIKVNRSHLMRKMKAKSVAELVRMEAHLKDVTSTQENYTVSRKGRLVINNFQLPIKTNLDIRESE